MLCRTKIIATLGPASSSPDTLHQLCKAGVDVFRLNCSHSTPEELRQTIESVRALERESGIPRGILADLQGPKLRIGTFEKGAVTLTDNAPFVFRLDPCVGNTEQVGLPHPEIFQRARPGHVIMVNDGRMRFRIDTVSADALHAVTLGAGTLSNHKGVNVPDIVLDVPSITAKDEEDLRHILDCGVDWVALSFIQHPEAITALRARLQAHPKGQATALMAKLEKPGAIEHLDAIIEAADGVMVARGDLGVELPPEDIPALQKRIINRCRWLSKPVVVATQMLESMIHDQRPTRAEASDVATAVYDGTDAVMLSAETAAGAYPVEAVAMMSRILARTERDPEYRKSMMASAPPVECQDGDVISSAAVRVAHQRGCSAIASYTSSGSTALLVARLRPPVPIMGLTPSLDVARRLTLVWGIVPRILDVSYSFARIAQAAADLARTLGFARIGESVVLTAGVPFGQPGTTNVLRLVHITDHPPAEDEHD